MSDSIPDIKLPADLLPTDGRFGSGPSKVREEAIEALAKAAPSYLGTSHRQPGVRSVVANIRHGLAELFRLPDGYEVVIGNGGATAFWDAAVFGLIEQKSQHLSFGEFSAKFAAAVARAPHLKEPEVIESPAGTHPEARPNPEIDLYALTQNETSTGVAMEIRRPDEKGLVLVDATSAAGGMRVDAESFDVYYFSPQKCFGSDGGLWVACCSPAAIERIERLTDSQRWIPPSLDLSIALDNSRKDQTYNTPALATIFLLSNQIDWMKDHGGMEWAATRCELSAAIVYGWAEESAVATPFVTRSEDRSPVTATIDIDRSVDAATVSAVLRENGIVDTESYRKLGRNQLRFALFPAIEPNDVAILTRAIEHVAERILDT